MGNNRWRTVRWAAAGAAVLAAAALARSAEAPEPCCFTNDEYAGVCRVVPAQDETCASILGYLNNPASTGKTYCDGTAIRGGWVQTRCNAEAQRRHTVAAPRRAGSR